jgi:hypothetical protein
MLSMVANRKSWRSEKQATRQVPLSGSAINKGLLEGAISEASDNAGKSLSNANGPE